MAKVHAETEFEKYKNKFIIGSLQDYKIAEVYLIRNYDGEYYAILQIAGYPAKNSKMKEEGVSWRLSCNYENSIVIEKLNMYDTAS